MINLSRLEDKKALIGTITVYLLLFLLLFLMSMFNACTEVSADEINSGGVAVSIGNPDDGGPDNSAAEEEVSSPPQPQEYTPENQLTSDVNEAPPVVKQEPKTETKPQQKTKPTDKTPQTKPTVKPPKINIGKNKGNDTEGKGKGGSSQSGGYKGKPDGIGSSPDGEGKGTMGQGTGDGPSLGPGVSGGIGGFSAKITIPEGGVQENGVVRLRGCVNEFGQVTDVKHAPKRGQAGTTSNRDLISRATYSVKKSSFKNISGSSGINCGFITYTFKLQ